MSGTTLAGRLYGRALTWRAMLTNARATNRVRTGLIASCAVDLVLYVLHRSARPTPLIYVSAIVDIRVRRRFYRFSMRQGSDDLYSCLPGREHDVEATILDLLRPGDVFVDVGANVGYYTILASEIVGDSGRVIAVEPVPETAAVMNSNVGLNHAANVDVVPKACWSARGTVSIWVPSGPYGLASLKARRARGSLQSVEAVTLDELCQGISQIRLIKIDVEGAEHEVLLGATETLAKTEFLVVELSENPDQARGLLHDASFGVRDLNFRPYVLASRD